MARVVGFEQRTIERPSRHKAARATFSVVEVNGEQLLQIDTYGSNDRVMIDKMSQSLQFDEGARRELRRILDQFD